MANIQNMKYDQLTALAQGDEIDGITATQDEVLAVCMTRFSNREAKGKFPVKACTDLIEELSGTKVTSAWKSKAGTDEAKAAFRSRNAKKAAATRKANAPAKKKVARKKKAASAPATAYVEAPAQATEREATIKAIAELLKTL